MSQEIQAYVEGPMASLPEPPQPASPGGAISLGRLLAMLRRRWLTVLAIWLPLAGLAASGVWFVMKPTYTATANVLVQPVLEADPLSQAEQQPMPMYDSYVRTQAELVGGNRVLTAALADPNVRGALLLNAADPLLDLRLALKVEPIRGSQIIQIGITRNAPAEAVNLAKAVVGAYQTHVVEAEKQEERKKLNMLESDQKRLRDDVNTNREERLKLANEFGASTDTTFDLLQQSISEAGLQTKQNLETIELEILQIKDQIKQLQEGVYTGLLPDETIEREQESIENDPTVQSIRGQLQIESARLARLKLGFTDEAKEVVNTRKMIGDLKVELEKERIRAADDLQKDKAAVQDRMKDSIISRKQLQLAAAERRRDELKKRVDLQEEQRKTIGRRGNEIQSLREDFERKNKDLELVEDKIKQIERRSLRPGRISIASDAEVLPGGVQDKRLKLGAAAVVGMLFFAVAVAFIKDRVDARVNAPEEVETSIGLRLLGVVPPVEELKSGRVTEQDFAECYRLVRVNLLSSGAGAGPPKAVLVTSAQAGEGKTSLAVSLAVSLAELGGRVLLVDGDIQAPRIGEVLGLDAPNSLKEALSGERPLADCAVPSKLSGLDVLITRINGHSVRGMLDSKTATSLVEQAAGRYDHIVIDSPPALGAADALVWAQAVDGVILSTFAGQSSVKAAQVACQRLKMVGAKLLGAVICNLSTSARFYSYSSASSRSSRSGTGETRSARNRTPPFIQLPVSDLEHQE